MGGWRRLVPLALGVALALSGCHKRPEGVLGEDEMVDLMADMQLAQAYYNTTAHTPGGREKDLLMESVMEKHGVSRAQLDSTVAYYGRNMDEYHAMLGKVEKKLRERSGQEVEDIPEDDIWPYSRFAALFPGQTSDGLIFSMPAEEVEPGDGIDWRMRLTSPEGVEIMMGIEYEDGTTSLIKKSAAGNRSLQVRLIADTALTTKRIFGAMTAPQASMPLWVDSIRLVKTDYDSLEYPKIRSQKRIAPPGRRVPPGRPETVSRDTVR